MKKIIVIISISYFIIYAALFCILNFNIITTKFFCSAIYAGIINLINVSATLYLFTLSENKSNKLFLILNLGGMGLRMFFSIIAILIAIKFLSVDLIGFILIFFLIYFILLPLEVFYFNKSMKRKNSI